MCTAPFHHFNKRQSMSRIPVLLRSSGRRESSKALLSFVICGWTLKREVVVQSFSINIYFCALSRIAYIYFLQRQVSTLYVINTTIYGRYKTLQIRKLCCRKKESSLLLIAAPQWAAATLQAAQSRLKHSILLFYKLRSLNALRVSKSFFFFSSSDHSTVCCAQIVWLL